MSIEKGPNPRRGRSKLAIGLAVAALGGVGGVGAVTLSSRPAEDAGKPKPAVVPTSQVSERVNSAQDQINELIRRVGEYEEQQIRSLQPLQSKAATEPPPPTAGTQTVGTPPVDEPAAPVVPVEPTTPAPTAPVPATMPESESIPVPRDDNEMPIFTVSMERKKCFKNIQSAFDGTHELGENGIPKEGFEVVSTSESPRPDGTTMRVTIIKQRDAKPDPDAEERARLVREKRKALEEGQSPQ